MNNKPHLLDWTNVGLTALVLGVIGYLAVEQTAVKVDVAAMKGNIQFETSLVKELKENYEDLDEKVDSHETRIAMLEATSGGDTQR